jgi:hypothetical protein
MFPTTNPFIANSEAPSSGLTPTFSPEGEKGGIDAGEIRRKPEISNLVLSR